MARNPLNEIQWPGGGLSVHGGFIHQEPGTTYDCLNVRGYDPTTNFLRGAQRCGISKYVATQLNGAHAIQNLNHVVIPAAASGSTNSVRTLKGVGVAGGTIKGFTAAGFTATSGGSGALSATAPFIGSAVFLQKVYYADGANYVVYDPAIDTVSAWTAAAGSLPTGGGGTPRLICVWRGRVVLSGLISDPQDWFMSAQFDATNFDYSPALTTATQAVAGNNTEAGLIPDIINAMIPYSDDVLIFLCDNSIWQMTGDPMAGGQIDRVSDIVGGAFGDSWCKDPFGNVYFMGSRGGLYAFHPVPGASAAPIRVSAQRVDEKLMTIDWSKNIVRFAWDDRFQTVMFFITPTAGGVTTNWAYDIRNEAFWPDQFANTNHNPTAVHLMDGDNPNDRVLLVGGRDGYVRMIDLNAKHDDGTAIKSHIYIGPLQAESGVFRMRELRGILSETSDDVSVELWSGRSPEDAFISTDPSYACTWSRGKNYSRRPMTADQAMYLKLSNNTFGTAWQYEAVYAELVALGLAAGRQL